MAANDFPLEPNWRLVLRDLGVRPADVLRRAGLPEDLFSRSSVRLSTDEYFRFWEGLRQEVNDPLFPIRLVEVSTAETFMPPVFAALCSPNLTIAMERLSKYKRLVAPIVLDVHQTSRKLSVTFRWFDTSVNPPTSLTVMELAFIVNLARMGTREQIQPLEAIAPKPPRSAAAVAKFLGVEVKRGPNLSISFSREDAERPFLTASDTVWKAFEPALRERLAELDSSASVSERVRAALLESLPSGQSSVILVAGRLAMSKRTLQRRLSEEDTTFLNLLNATRLDLANHYLTRTTLSCTEISFLLGFEDPNSFFRAFHDWTGDTPENVRHS